ncbi:MAG: O-antigen ligase family protein [Lachnospiraceae bacterium]|nr:O-antigen ligase family protein [Lachnospiraceae bacterium]
MNQVKKIMATLPVLPVFLALGFVPLIVSAKKYTTGLNGYDWFSNSETSVDIFLYWKGRALILLACIMFFILVVRFVRRTGKKAVLPFLCLCCYLLLAVLSTIFSRYPSFSLWGSYEQWEGLLVLLAYGILFFYAYQVTDCERMVRVIVYGIIIGSFLLGLIGTFQFFRMDLFRSDIGKSIMNLMSGDKMSYTFNFSDGWVYATLYNPNYVGSYAALTFPISVAVAVIEWKKLPVVITLLSMASTCLLTITLLGSQSLTGCIGVIAGLLFLVIYMFPVMKRKLGKRKMTGGLLGTVVFIGILCFLFPEEIRFGTDKLFYPTADYHLVRELRSTMQGLGVSTVKGDSFYVTVTENKETPLEVMNASGESISLEYEREKDYYTLQNEAFTDFRLYPKEVTVKGKSYPAVCIFNPPINKEWTVAKTEGGYMIYNAFHKLDNLREIPEWGFEKNQHFGDKRGYIWSRTFPLLKDYLLLGAGPNTFTLIFPNDDYVGKTNMNYDEATVTKPHNIYLQIWTQTGLFSLIAFILLFLLYFVDSVRLYFNKTEYSVLDKLGVAFLIGIFSYMVTGLANDSTVAVAPVYWGMLGAGMALNGILRIRQKDGG